MPQRNAALADLDDVLRALLEEELAKVGMSGVTISFESPNRERTSAWPSPAINLFLYDLREAAAPRDRSFHERPGGISTVLERAPMRLACTYAITVWTREVRDEHQILSQLLSILLAYPSIPAQRLPPSLLVGGPDHGLSARVGQAKEDGRADFWTAIGSPYKVSLEYVVTVLCSAGIQLERGKRTRRAAVSGVVGDEHGFPGEPLHPLAGRVVDAAGDGVRARVGRDLRRRAVDDDGRGRPLLLLRDRRGRARTRSPRHRRRDDVGEGDGPVGGPRAGADARPVSLIRVARTPTGCAFGQRRDAPRAAPLRAAPSGGARIDVGQRA